MTSDETSCGAGTLEYVPGSHLWPVAPIPEGFQAPDNWRVPMRVTAVEIALPVPALMGMPAVSCVLDAGEACKAPVRMRWTIERGGPSIGT